MWYFEAVGRERDVVDDAGGRIIEGSMGRDKVSSDNEIVET